LPDVARTHNIQKINKNLPFDTLLKQSDSVVDIDSKEKEPVHVCTDFFRSVDCSCS